MGPRLRCDSEAIPALRTFQSTGGIYAGKSNPVMKSYRNTRHQEGWARLRGRQHLRPLSRVTSASAWGAVPSHSWASFAPLISLFVYMAVTPTRLRTQGSCLSHFFSLAFLPWPGFVIVTRLIFLRCILEEVPPLFRTLHSSPLPIGQSPIHSTRPGVNQAGVNIC